MGVISFIKDKLSREPEHVEHVDSGWRECKYINECRQKCGHREPHKKNNGCNNPCYHTGEPCVECDPDKTLGT